MFTQRLDPAGGGSGGALRLDPEEEPLIVEMVPFLRSAAMGKKAGSLSGTEEDDAMESALEEVRDGPIVNICSLCLLFTCRTACWWTPSYRQATSSRLVVTSGCLISCCERSTSIHESVLMADTNREA